jgi:hypothetical protein
MLGLCGGWVSLPKKSHIVRAIQSVLIILLVLFLTEAVTLLVEASLFIAANINRRVGGIGR